MADIDIKKLIRDKEFELQGDRYACLVCSKKKGVLRSFEKKSLRSHLKTTDHRRALERHRGTIHTSIAIPTASTSRRRSQSPTSRSASPSHPSQSRGAAPSTSFDHLSAPESGPTPEPPSSMSSPTSSEESGDDNDPTVTAQDYATIGSMWRSRINRIVNLGPDQRMPDLFEAFMAAQGPQREQLDSEDDQEAFWEGTGDVELPDKEDGVESDEEISVESGPLHDFGFELPPRAAGTGPSQFSSRSATSVIPPNCPTYPWPNMSMFLTHTLFSSATLRFSEAQKRAILEWGKAMKAPDVPTKYALSKIAERIRKLVGDPTRKVVSLSGNVFYINEVSDAIAKDYANPITRSAMVDYPRQLPGDCMSQVQNGEKMLSDLPGDIVSPAVQVKGQVFFVNELLRRNNHDHSYFIPERFMYYPIPVLSQSASSTTTPSSTSTTAPRPPKTVEQLCALGRNVKKTTNGFVVDDERVIVLTDTFEYSYEQLEEKNALSCGFVEKSAPYEKKMPHPLRKKANGRMVYAVPLIIFMDDVSGNISKQWNKHHVIYMSNANLPREMIEKEFCIRFVTSSPHAAPMELMSAMKESIRVAAEQGVSAYDIKTNEDILLIPYGLFLGGDNPMQAEECSHGGLKCNYFCRTCHVGGTKEQKQTLAGYNALFEPGKDRTPAETKEEILSQIKLAFLPGGAEKMKNATTKTGVCDTSTRPILNTLAELGKSLRASRSGQPALTEDEVRKKLEDELETILKGTSIEDHINPLLGMPGINVHQDTPTEMLHTFLLGVVKYYWAQTVFVIEKSKKMDLFRRRLQALSTDGLNAPSFNADYMCRYKGSLVGKHFKSLAQVMPFAIYDLVPSYVLQAWNTLGELVVLLWHTEIQELEPYLADLSRAIEDLLNITAECAPSILLSKSKFHFLVHLTAYIRRFGPPILFSTERYESFNRVFRLTSIYSNRQAPSRDTCTEFASHDIIKHIVTGGFWYDDNARRWVKAGTAILEYEEEHPEHAQFLGLWATPKQVPVGTVKYPPTSKDDDNASGVKAVPGSATQAMAILQIQEPEMVATFSNRSFLQGQSFVTASGEQAKLGSHVMLASGNQCAAGKILELLVTNNKTPNDASNLVSYVLIQQFEFLPSRHHKLHLPRLALTEEKVVVNPSHIQCILNIQHDCEAASCTDTDKVAIWQERQASSFSRMVVRHNMVNMWLLNTHSIHNYRDIKNLIPKTLPPRPPPVADPAAVRANAVASMATKKQEAQSAKGKGKASSAVHAGQSARGKQKAAAPPPQVSMPPDPMPGSAALTPDASTSQTPHGFSFALPSPILKRKSEDHPAEDMQPPKLRKPPAPRPRSKPSVPHSKPSFSPSEPGPLPHYGSQHPPPSLASDALQPQLPAPSSAQPDPHDAPMHTTDLTESESPWPRWPPPDEAA